LSIDLGARIMTRSAALQLVQRVVGPFRVTLDGTMVSRPVRTARGALAGTVMLFSRQALS
jgi:hypothetical protein